MEWPSFKRNPDKDLESLSVSLQASLGNKLNNVVVFGSYVRGEFDPKRSNVNVLVISDLSPAALSEMGPAFKAWLKKGHVPPVLVSPGEINDFARDFPVEFLDMKESHKVLFGENPFPHLQVDLKHLEGEIEHDLAVLQLRLRQAIASAEGDERRLEGVLAGVRSSVAALLRAARRLSSEAAIAIDKIQAAFDSSSGGLSTRYLSLMDSVLKYLRSK